MKKILNLIYSSNDWYEDLQKKKQDLFFFIVIVGSNIISNIILYIYDSLYPIIIWFVLIFLWRLPYVFRPKKTYIFDIETQGQHNSNFDVAFMVKKEKGKSTEIIDTFTMITKINEKNKK